MEASLSRVHACICKDQKVRGIEAGKKTVSSAVTYMQ